MLLAGCTGFTGGGGQPQESATSGTVNIYLSDERNQIDDFRSGWTTIPVSNVTVDLTELQGENATRLGVLTAPNGTYNMVFVHVKAVNGTLSSGEEVAVQLPSQTLRVNTAFTVAPGEQVNFVFDLSVFSAGESGKYVL